MEDATVSAAGMRVVRLLVGNPPRTVADLMKATGVTRTAVTEQLDELVEAGFVERVLQRLPGRGRPRYLYSATDAALLLLFASNQHLVVPAMWQAIEHVGGLKMKRQVLRRVGKLIAEHYKSRITAKLPKTRLKQFIKLLEEEGGLIDVAEDNGRMVLRKRSCPFITMRDDKRSVCAVDAEVMTQVVGRRVRQTSCRLDGAPCCTFEIVGRK